MEDYDVILCFQDISFLVLELFIMTNMTWKLGLTSNSAQVNETEIGDLSNFV